MKRSASVTEPPYHSKKSRIVFVTPAEATKMAKQATQKGQQATLMAEQAIKMAAKATQMAKQATQMAEEGIHMAEKASQMVERASQMVQQAGQLDPEPPSRLFESKDKPRDVSGEDTSSHEDARDATLADLQPKDLSENQEQSTQETAEISIHASEYNEKDQHQASQDLSSSEDERDSKLVDEQSKYVPEKQKQGTDSEESDGTDYSNTQDTEVTKTQRDQDGPLVQVETHQEEGESLKGAETPTEPQESSATELDESTSALSQSSQGAPPSAMNQDGVYRRRCASRHCSESNTRYTFVELYFHSLTNHEGRIHCGEPFEVGTGRCGKMFKAGYQLEDHLFPEGEHIGSANFKCNRGLLSFTHLSSLGHHMVRKSPCD